MSNFPIKHTFIHFTFESPYQARSQSAPPSYNFDDAPNVYPAELARRQKRKKRRQKLADKETTAIRSYRSLTLRETWSVLVTKLQAREIEYAKDMSKHVPRLRFKLPENLFNDWAFYTFPSRDSKAVSELFGKRILRRNVQREVELWCSATNYFGPQKEFLRDMCANARKVLEGLAKGYFTVHVNSDIGVFLLYNKDALLEDIAHSIRNLLHLKGKAILTHRHRQLRAGSMASNLLRPGCQIAINFV